MNVTDRILQEASKMIISNGIRSVTMDDIANQVGISKRTLYENFKDKDELLINSIMFYHEKQFKTKFEMTEQLEGVVNQIMEIIYLIIEDIRKIHPSFHHDLRKYHYSIWQKISQMYNQDKIEKITSLIYKGIEEGVFRKEINVNIVAIAFNEQFQIITNDEIFPRNLFSSEEVMLNVLVTFILGISTPHGMSIIEQKINEKKNKPYNQ